MPVRSLFVSSSCALSLLSYLPGQAPSFCYDAEIRVARGHEAAGQILIIAHNNLLRMRK